MAWSAAGIGGERRRNVGGDGGDETLARPLVALVGGEKREKQTQRFEESGGNGLAEIRQKLLAGARRPGTTVSIVGSARFILSAFFRLLLLFVEQ
jgi:hypothetical protein